MKKYELNSWFRVLIFGFLLIGVVRLNLFVKTNLSVFNVIISFILLFVAVLRWKMIWWMIFFIFNLLHLLIIFLPSKDCGTYNSKELMSEKVCRCVGVKKYDGVITGNVRCIGKIIE